MNKSYNFEKKISHYTYMRSDNQIYDIGLKINLYKGFEAEALIESMRLLSFYDDRLKINKSPIECVMVGDSYFMTHLGRDTTHLKTLKLQENGLNTMVSLVNEVASVIKNSFVEDKKKPFLIADMPDGSLNTMTHALKSAERMVKAGADVIKVEIFEDSSLKTLTELVKNGFSVMAHIGYTPQHGSLKRYGDTFNDAISIFKLAQKIRDCGANSIILEMVSETVNQALSKFNQKGLPIYSIFSGYAKNGGQCLNVWDSVFVRDPPSAYFPSTAIYSRSQYPEVYKSEIITRKIMELIMLTLSKKFPLSPLSSLSINDKKRIQSIDPWESIHV